MAVVTAVAAVVGVAGSVVSAQRQAKATKSAARAQQRQIEQQRKIDEQRRLAEKRQVVRQARTARAEVISQGVGRDVAGSAGIQGGASSVGGQARGTFSFLDNITEFARVGSEAASEAAFFQGKASSAAAQGSIFSSITNLAFSAGAGDIVKKSIFGTNVSTVPTGK